MGLYPDTEADSEELVGTHLGPGPVPEALSVGHGEDGSVLPVVVVDSSSLQERLVPTQRCTHHRQQGDRLQHTGHHPGFTLGHLTGTRRCWATALIAPEQLPIRLDD